MKQFENGDKKEQEDSRKKQMEISDEMLDKVVGGARPSVVALPKFCAGERVRCRRTPNAKAYKEGTVERVLAITVYMDHIMYIIRDDQGSQFNAKECCMERIGGMSAWT